MPTTYNEQLTSQLQNGRSLTTIADYYANAFKDNEPANAFLQRRQLHRDESIALLRLEGSEKVSGTVY